MVISKKAAVFLTTAICLDAVATGGGITLAGIGIANIIESISDVGSGIFAGLAGNHLFRDKNSGFDSEMEEVFQKAVAQTLEDVKSDFFKGNGIDVPWWRRQSIKAGFVIPDLEENFTTQQSLIQNFFDPILHALNKDEFINQAISGNLELSPKEMLEKLIDAQQIHFPEYRKEYQVKIMEALLDGFKEHFLFNLRENLIKNEPARKYYQILLLQSTVQLLTKLEKSVDQLLNLAKFHEIEISGLQKNVINSSQTLSSQFEEIQKEFREQFSLQLTIHRVRKTDIRDQFRFDSLFTDFQGRTRELEILFDFLEDDRKFLFFAVSGPGGTGKSRLANEVCLRAENIRWIAGFCEQYNNSGFQWKNFQPKNQTLIVFDYIKGRKETILQILETFSSMQSDGKLKEKIRVLLLERHFDEDLNNIIFNSKTRTNYYTYQQNHQELPLVISPMNADIRWSIIEQVLKPNPKRLNKLLLKKHIIIKELDKQDPERRPLFAFFTAIALLEGQEITDWNTNDNLQYNLNRLESKVWSQISIWNNPSLRTPIKHLIWLGAICEYLNYKDFETIRTFSAFGKLSDHWETQDFWDQLTQLFRLQGSENSKGELPGLKPDLLAEHFIITHIAKCASIPPLKENLDQLFQCAWKIRPDWVWWMSYLTLSNYRGQGKYDISAYLQWLNDKEEILLVGDSAIKLFNNIGALYFNKFEIENSKKWFLKAAELHDPNAMVNLANLLLSANPKQALEWYEKAAMLGHTGGMKMLASQLTKDFPEKAKYWHRKAANLGDSEAMFYLANLLSTKNLNQALKWYKKAAKLGHLGSMNHLAVYLGKNNPKKALPWLRKAAKFGDVNDIFNLAFSLHNDHPEEAMEWYRKAAELGDAIAMNNLALLLQTKDSEQAKDWYRKAAKLGYSLAMINLANLLQKDHSIEALKWLREAAGLDDPNAKYQLSKYLWERNINPEEAWQIAGSLLNQTKTLDPEFYYEAIWLRMLISAWSKSTIYEKERKEVFDLLAQNFPKAIGNMWILLYHDYSDFLLYEFENGIHSDYLKKNFPAFHLVILHFLNSSSAHLENFDGVHQEEFTLKIQLIDEKRAFYAQ
jgi:TPR repeat protein